jgi:hypothetical protein
MIMKWTSVGLQPQRPILRRRRRWENNIRLDIREIVWVSVDWIHLARDRDQLRIVVNTVMNFWVP